MSYFKIVVGVGVKLVGFLHVYPAYFHQLEDVFSMF